MADETLKIRVDVETATLRQLSDALKSVKNEMKDASQGALPQLKAESAALSSKIENLSGRHTGLTHTIKEARSEARMFRFALLEMVHGFDGVANAMVYFTGATEHSAKNLNTWTGAAKDGLASGLGLKFALDAVGVAGAAPIAAAVGVITLLGSGLGKTAEAAMQAEVSIGKLDDKIHSLRKDLGEVSKEQDVQFLEKQLAAALQRRTKFLNERHVDWMQSAFKFRAVMSDETEKIRQLDVDVDEARKKLNETFKTDAKEIEKIQKSGFELVIEKLELRIKKEEELKSILNPRYKQEQEMLKVYLGIVEALKSGNQELLTRTANESLMNRIRSGNAEMMKSSRGVSVGGAPDTGIKKEPEEELGGWLTGLDLINSGMQAVSATVNDSLVRAFGRADSVFQQFALGVVQGIAQIAEQLASAAIISGIFALFGGGFGTLFSKIAGFADGGTLYEPVIGQGASGKMYSFAERSPERFSPLTSFNQGGGNSTSRVVVEGRISGRDLILVQKESRIIDRKKGGNF